MAPKGSGSRSRRRHVPSELEFSPSQEREQKLEAARDAVSGLEIRVADINNTASIQELFSELSTVDHVYIAAGSTKTGGPLDHPLNDFRHKFDERLWGSIDVVRAAHRLMRPGGSFTFTGGLSSDRPVSGALGVGIATMATEQLARVPCSGTRAHSLQCHSTRLYRYPDVGLYLSGERSTSAQRRHKETPDSPSGDRR